MISISRQTDAKKMNVIMDHDSDNPNGTYGKNLVPYVLKDGILFKAKEDNIDSSEIPGTSIKWAELSASLAIGTRVITGDVTISEQGLNYISTDVVDSTITIDTGSLADRETMTVSNLGNGTIDIVAEDGYTVEGKLKYTLGTGDQISLAKDEAGTDMRSYAKHVSPLLTAESFFIGLNDVDGVLELEIIPIGLNNEVDLTKYNMEFEDGSPVAIIVDSKPVLTNSQTLIGIDIT